MISLDDLERIAEIEFTGIVSSTEKLSTKMRIMLVEGGFIDVWLSRKLKGHFGFHWEHKATTQSYVTITSPIRSGRIFPPIHITSIMTRKAM